MVVRDRGYEDRLARQFAVDPDPTIDPEDHLIIRHTGGTSGDSSLPLTPISHGSGYLFTPIWQGGGRNVMAEKFDPADLPELAHSHAPDMRRERTACLFMVPTILNAINRILGVERIKFPDLKCMMMSAAPISDETVLKA